MSHNATHCTTYSPTPPGLSAICAVPLYSNNDNNNSAILASCCNGAAISDYAQGPSSPFCWQYCNITGPLFNESDVWKCLHGSDVETISCRDEVKESGAGRGVGRLALMGVAVFMGGLVGWGGDL